MSITDARGPETHRVADQGCPLLRRGFLLMWLSIPQVTIAAVMAAVFNLNHPAHVVTWHFFSMSVANLIVIAVMLIVFVLAIALPFPAPHEEDSR